MSYPKMTEAEVSRFVTEVLIRDDISEEVVEEFFTELKITDAGVLDLSKVEHAATDLFEKCRKTKKFGANLDQLEIDATAGVFSAFDGLPLPALGDVEFWSYCSARYFWGFISLRQRSSILKARGQRVKQMLSEDALAAEEESVPLRRYVLGKDHYQIPLRLFLRGQAVNGDGAFIEDNPVEKATDFWRSHILAVRTAAYPSWARPLLGAQSKAKYKIDDQRPAARKINRIRANVSPVLHSEAEAKAIVEPIWLDKK
jgi:hypothetical protein